MTAYLIHWNGAGASKCEVLTFPTKLAAETYAYEALPGDRTAIPVEDVLDLHDRATFSGPRLVEIFNAITGNDPGVKKFESLDTARERVFRELTNRFHDVPYAIHPVTQELAMSEAADTTKPKREKKPSTRSPSLTQRKRLNPAAKIHLLVAENPARASRRWRSTASASWRMSAENILMEIISSRDRSISKKDWMFSHFHSGYCRKMA